MHIDREDLERAAAGLVTPEQAAALWEALAARARPPARPEPAGARRAVEASALGAAAVAAAALAAHALVRWTGLAADPGAPSDTLAGWARSGGFAPGLAALGAAALALRVLARPFLCAVLVAAAWLVAIDAAPLLFGADPSWQQDALVSAVVGLVALGAGVAVDGRTRRDHAFWLYLAGLVAFWGGMTTAGVRSGATLALGAFVNASLVAVALVLRRRTFAVFGAVGLAGIAGRLASAHLVDEVLPLVLAAIAAAVVAAAVLYGRLEASASRALVAHLPRGLRALLPPVPAAPPPRR